MNERLAVLFFACAVVVAGCGGGGSSGAGGPNPAPAPTQTAAPQGNLPLSETVSGSAAWVHPATHKTLYFLDVDTAMGGTCTAGCASVWPVFTPSSGSQNTDNVTIITRSDGAGQQWAYQGHPLYNFTGDSGPDQANGDLAPDFGGHWHVARPAPTPTPSGGGNPPPCHGYC